MVDTCEDELICDFAEFYHIYDYKSLPKLYAATLANGLRDDSRTKMKLSGAKVRLETLLLAGTVDRLSLLAWLKTKDAEKGLNKPTSIVDVLLNEKKETVKTYTDVKAFNEARAAILNRINGG